MEEEEQKLFKFTSDFKISLIILVIISVISVGFGVAAYLEPKDASDKIRLSVETVPRRMPRFTSAAADTDSLLERIVGISPETGVLSKGVRTKPYLSFSFIETEFIWVTPFGTSDNYYVFGYGTGSINRYQVIGWLEQSYLPGSTTEYTFKLDNHGDDTITDPMSNMATIPWNSGILRVRGYTPNNNNCQFEYMTLDGDRQIVVSVLDTWDWAGAPLTSIASGKITRLSDTVIAIVQSCHADMKVIYLELGGAGGTPTVVTKSAILTYTTTSRIKEIVGVVQGDNTNYGIYIVHEHDNEGKFSRRRITWDGTTNAPVVAELDDGANLRTVFFSAEFVRTSNGIVLKDGSFLTVCGVGESQNRSNSLFYHVDFEAQSLIELEDDFEVTEGNGVARLLAYDPENETFMVSWLNPFIPNVLRINFCRWNSTEKRVDSLDAIMVPGIPTASDAFYMGGGKYMFVLRSGQLMPLWASLESKSISFHPSKARKPLGYMDANGDIIGDGWTVALPGTWEGLVEIGSPLYTDLEGRVIPANDQRVFGFSRAGYFLGNPTLMLLDLE